jgi:hypothetical protein
MMASDLLYFPTNGQYWPIENSIYAQYYGQCPNPCRKYHISSALEGAEHAAAIVLPYLVQREIFHKIVKSQSMLSRQMAGKQAGKFITVYMPAHVEHRNAVVAEIGALLSAARERGQISPSPTMPRSRPYSHVFIETPLDEGCFIYGGSIVDPTA